MIYRKCATCGQILEIEELTRHYCHIVSKLCYGDLIGFEPLDYRESTSERHCDNCVHGGLQSYKEKLERDEYIVCHAFAWGVEKHYICKEYKGVGVNAIDGYV